MNNRAAKLIALMLIAALMLGGCNLIRTDPKYLAQQEAERLAAEQAAYEADMDTVLASYTGGTVTKREVISRYESSAAYMEAYNQNMNSMYYYYFGAANMYTLSAEDYENVKREVITARAQQEVVEAKAIELGVGEFTSDELAAMTQEAQDTFEQAVSSYITNYGLDDATARAYLLEDGYTQDSFYESLYFEKLNERLSAHINAETEITDDEVLDKYAALIADQQTQAESDPSSIEQLALDGEDAYYYPEGYRYVKHILIKPSDDALLTQISQKQSEISALDADISALDDQINALLDADTEPLPTDGEVAPTKAELEADKADKLLERDRVQTAYDDAVAAAWLDMQPTIDEINAKTEAGEDFDALIAEYSQDPGSLSEPVKSKGYLIYESSANWDPAFLEAAAGIALEGECSQPVLGSYGVHIIRYETRLEPGALPFESVEEQVRQTAYADKCAELYAAQQQIWYEEAQIEYFFDAWKL